MLVLLTVDLRGLVDRIGWLNFVGNTLFDCPIPTAILLLLVKAGSEGTEGGQFGWVRAVPSTIVFKVARMTV